MNTPQDAAPRQPVVFDQTTRHRDRTEIRTLADTAIAEQYMLAAKRLGGYTVSVLAEAGDTYTVLHEEDYRVRAAEYKVPEGKVIVEMQNTADPNNPSNMSGLYKSL